ncbi:hybrid sensor histidine kinase/response regulator [Chitinophaga nivalis]|uniref:hybrid sensor histidine kinase/response regulator n=1 Tax=Chitinophaga nivalis TaxID=2991709 RepID=UPI00222829C2|nr:response regulator [Chitinophaga nivalis]MCW3461856.1 response regulator [Chitinophaga nivalis]
MILIVDDKPENILSIRKTLELYKFEVDAAASGEEALKKILKHSYTLIILDVQMPSMDGFEVAEAISGYSKARDIPIIFLSAVNKDKRFIVKGYDSGGMDYLTKPIDPDILLMKVKTFSRLYQQSQELKHMHQSLKEEVEVRKLAQAALSEKVNELRTTLEVLPQIAFTLTVEGRIEYANRNWFKYADDIEQLPETLPMEKSMEEYLRETIIAGAPLEKEVYLKDKLDNNYRCHLLRVIPVREGAAIVKWIGTFTDIAHQKQVSEILERKVRERTEELIDINKSLEASNHDLQQFASVASHDLKEPLRKIQLFGAILRDRFLQMDPGAMSYMERIVKASERMAKLINDLLSYSRLSAVSTYEVTDLNTIVQEILTDLELTISEKKAVIRVGHIPCVEAVPGQIRQVFQNIISNALKFSHNEMAPEITISGELVKENKADSSSDPEGTYCRITFRDNGIGFNEKYLSKIFTIFQRLHSPDLYEGTGIGLAIAKKVIDKHQGIISASSTEGEGAVFVVVLPVLQGKVMV